MSRSKSPLSGGFDLLDQTDRLPVDPDLKELTEPLNLRTSDPLDLALAEVLAGNPGGYIANKQFIQEVKYSSRPVDHTFDRYYWNQKLLIDFIQLPTSEPQKELIEKTVAEKRAIAEANGLRYLPILGSITLEALKAAVK